MWLCNFMNSIAVAQQDAMYSQYMYNMLPLNPAYAGSREALSATALYRNQWMGGIDGAPVSQTLSIHTLLKNEKVGLGLTIANDKIAIQSNINIQLVYSYIINIGAGKLALGLQGGAINYKSDFSSLTFTNSETIAPASVSKFYPSVGAGAYFRSEKVYIGLSAPRITAFQGKSTQDEVLLAPHYYFTSGLNINLGDHFTFRPSVLLRATQGVPLQSDVNGSFLYNSLLGLGVSYRHEESLIPMIQLYLGKFKIGYAYDYGLGAIAKISNGSHEIFLNFETTLIKDKVVSPRFF